MSSAAPTPGADGGTELQALRLLSVGAAALAAAVVVGQLVVVGHSDDLTLPGWYRVLVIGSGLLPIAVAVAALFCGAAMLRRLSGLSAATHLGALALFWPAMLLFAPGPVHGPLAWMLSISACSVVGAVVAWGPRGGWAALIASTVLVGAARVALADVSADSLVNDVHVLISSVVVCLLCGAVIDVSRELDGSIAVAASAASLKESERAQQAALLRTERLVHDEVLSTLVVAGRSDPAVRAAVAREATRVSILIHELARAEQATLGMSPRTVATRLRALVDEIDPECRVQIGCDGPASDEEFLPPGVGDALLAATRQALVNSHEHAGAGASRSITLTVDHRLRSLRLVIADDGVGFDPDSATEGRLGVSSSILARVRELPGGTARLHSQRAGIPGSARSRPGGGSAGGRSPGGVTTRGGTVVDLSWALPTVHHAASSPDAPADDDLPPDDDLVAERRGFRRSLAAAACLFLLAQVVLAVVASTESGSVLLPLAALLGNTAGTVTLGFTGIGVLSAWRSGTVVLIVAVTAAAPLLVRGSPLTGTWELWYLSGLAVLLLTLALRGRVPHALLGAGLLAASTVLSMIVHGDEVRLTAASLVRPLVIVGLAVAFTIATTRLRRRIRSLHAQTLQLARRRAWDATTRAELTREARELERELAPMLDRLQRLAEPGPPLTEAEASECLVLEGALRDRYRGGRLSRAPLTTAVAAARRRGLDVVLLDDAPGEALPDEQLVAVIEWMAGLLGQAESGRFVGRLMPSGRRAIASAVHDDAATLFRGRSPAGDPVALARFEN